MKWYSTFSKSLEPESRDLIQFCAILRLLFLEVSGRLTLQKRIQFILNLVDKASVFVFVCS